MFNTETIEIIGKKGSKQPRYLRVVRFDCDDLHLNMIHSYCTKTFGPQDRKGEIDPNGWYLYDGRLGGIGIRLSLLPKQYDKFMKDNDE